MRVNMEQKYSEYGDILGSVNLTQKVIKLNLVN